MNRTIESMVFALGGSVKEATVHDLLGREIKASYEVLEDVVNEQLNIDIVSLSGSGAAGGMGAASVAFLQAEMSSGIDLILEYYHFDDHIVGADLLITGEGKLDSQTLSCKVISGLCKKARVHNIQLSRYAARWSFPLY
jgi:glycerate kinase